LYVTLFQPHDVEVSLTPIFLSLGSNLGDRKLNLTRAVTSLQTSGRLRVVGTSSLYETEPVGREDQPWFLNAVVRAETVLSPHELLALLKGVERQLGRGAGSQRCGPRTIDLDILLYGSQTVSSPDLIIPHPGLEKRRFVLEALAELAPRRIHPVRHRTINYLLKHLRDPHRVVRVGSPDEWLKIHRD
jgi:2-amino-4-hydroxy-6-hydroxymethyldihydropteridine diphosphokinase